MTTNATQTPIAIDERRPVTLGLILSLIAVIGVPAVGFGVAVLQKLNSIETSLKLMSKDISAQTQRIDGNLPAVLFRAWVNELRAANKDVIFVPDAPR